MQTIFYVLACIALSFYIADKVMEWILDFKELRSAIRVRRAVKRIKK